MGHKISKEGMEALDKAIERWKLRASGENVERYSPLCEQYSKINLDDYVYSFSCTDCPVKVYAGKARCFGTPFQDWDKHVCLCPYCDNDKPCKEGMELAQKEVDFLIRVKEYFKEEA